MKLACMRPLADKKPPGGRAACPAGEILGQLAVQKLRGVFAFHANHAEVGQGGNAIQKGKSWLNYDALLHHTGSRVVRRLLALFVFWIAWAAPLPHGGCTSRWPHGAEPLELAIEPGTTARGVARDVVAAGVRPTRAAVRLVSPVSGQDRQIKAGNYEIPAGHHATHPAAQAGARRRGLRALTWWKAGTSARCARRWPRKTSSSKTRRS
jgi:hypothetical protein